VSQDQHRSRRLRTHGVVGLLVLALVGGMTGWATGAAPAPQAATAPLSLGEHLQILAKYGRNYSQRLRPEVVERLSAGGQTLIKMARMGDKLADMARGRKRHKLGFAPSHRVPGRLVLVSPTTCLRRRTSSAG
jgi:hypothetical protein